MSVDTRSPELAQASKANYVFPGSATQQIEAEKAAAARSADKDTPHDPTASTVSSNVVTKTVAIHPVPDPVPEAPVITDPETDDVVADATPAIVGTAVANSEIDLYVDDVLTEEDVAVDGSGDWTVTLDTLANAVYEIYAICKLNGYSSLPSEVVTFEVDV